MIRILVTWAVVLGFSLPVQAAWVNTSGTVEEVWAYLNNDTFLVRLDNQPGSVGQSSCTASSFGVSDTSDRIYSMVQTAMATGRRITITVDDVAACVSGFVPVVRVIGTYDP